MTNAAQRIDRGIREEFVADNIVSADKIDLIKKNNTDASEGTHASIPKPTTPVKKIIFVSSLIENNLGILYLHVYHHNEPPTNKLDNAKAVVTLHLFSSETISFPVPVMAVSMR